MRRARKILLVLSLLVTAAATAAPPQVADFTGRVTDTDHRGIANLEVKLTPPRDTKLPIRLGSTDRNGVFLFRQLAPGRYLVELSQGVYLLYRAQVDTTKESHTDITLRSR